MNLYNLGLSGLNAAQARLNTTGHNINNVDTDGYNRQSVVVSTAGGTGTVNGFFGRGVMVDAVRRSYDGFLYRQMVSAQSDGASMVAYGNQISQLDNLLADDTVGISPALKNFFDSVQAVASSPADPAGRQELIGQASNLVTQINEANRFLNDQRNDINNQIGTTVEQINSYVQRINDLNRQISAAKASAPGQPPNDLYDQRDQMVTELNQLISVDVTEQGDTFNLSVGTGQVLLSGQQVFPLRAVPSSSDPSRTVVAFTAPTGQPGKTMEVELDDSVLRGGRLGGLLEYRRTALDSVQNDLGRMAIGLAKAFNDQHAQGVDLNGAAGDDFFSYVEPTAMRDAGNQSAAGVSATFVDTNRLTSSDYRIEFDGANYTITRVPENTRVYTGDGADLGGAPPTLIDGMQINLSGTPAAGDSWLLQPTRNAGRDLGLAIGDPAKIAAADADGGSANGNNALELAGLQTAKILGRGTMSLNEAFSQLVDNVGVQAQQNATASKAQANLIQQTTAAQQALSGVNLNEEEINLQRYTEQFAAAARLIDVGTQLFDTILGLKA